jgi:hypothetical protein
VVREEGEVAARATGELFCPAQRKQIADPFLVASGHGHRRSSAIA